MNPTKPADLTIHDQIIKDISALQPNGQIGFFKQLTFWVGDHGPFLKTWPVAIFDATTARKYMTDQVQELRLILGP